MKINASGRDDLAAGFEQPVADAFQLVRENPFPAPMRRPGGT